MIKVLAATKIRSIYYIHHPLNKYKDNHSKFLKLTLKYIKKSHTMILPQIIFSCLQQYCFRHIKAELAFLLCFSGCSLQLEFGTLVCHTTNPARMLCEHIILNVFHLTKRKCVFLCMS